MTPANKWGQNQKVAAADGRGKGGSIRKRDDKTGVIEIFSTFFGWWDMGV